MLSKERPDEELKQVHLVPNNNESSIVQKFFCGLLSYWRHWDWGTGDSDEETMFRVKLDIVILMHNLVKMKLSRAMEKLFFSTGRKPMAPISRQRLESESVLFTAYYGEKCKWQSNGKSLSLRPRLSMLCKFS